MSSQCGGCNVYIFWFKFWSVGSYCCVIVEIVGRVAKLLIEKRKNDINNKA